MEIARKRSSNARYKTAWKPSKWRQFKVLLKKQFLYAIRDKSTLYSALSLPISMIFLIFILRPVLPAIDIKPLPPLTEGTCSTTKPNCVHMGYVDYGTNEKTLKNLQALFKYSEPYDVSMRRFPSFNELVQHAKRDQSSLVVGVTLHNSDIAKSVSYQIHSNYTLFTSGDYLSTRSLTIQAYIERALTNVRRQKAGRALLSSPLPSKEINLGRNFISGIGRSFISYTKIEDVAFTKLERAFTSMVILLGIFPSITSYCITILNMDRKNRMKERILTTGLSQTVYLSTIWMYLLSFMLLSFAIVSIILYAALLNSIKIVYLFGAMIPYGLSMIALCTLLSLIESTNASSLAGIFLSFGAVIASCWYQLFSIYKFSHTVNQLFLLISPIAFSQIVVLSRYDTFEEMNHPKYGVSFSVAMLMLLVDSILYLVLAWYISHLKPGVKGISLPWNFLFCSSYWKSTKLEATTTAKDTQLLAISNVRDEDKHMFENQDIGSIAPEERGVILITGLKKSFKASSITAVNHLDLDLNRGQVLALLGHNGAGKTTTVSMLSGLTLPDSGTISILGHSLPTLENRGSDVLMLSKIQQLLGVCPQSDILMDNFSAFEHMELFAAIRGLTVLGKIEDDGSVTEDNEEDLQKEYIYDLMADVSLADKCFENAGSYSGGMKRKLSLAIALLGNPSILLLDEPTTGMDVYSRSSIWQLIEDSKKDRIVILTTHSMEEADALGDRIAIMSNGRLQALGSPLFLKSRFGVGYHLSLIKEASIEFDLKGLTAFIKSYIAAAEVSNNSPQAISYLLPSNQERFPDFFDALEVICQRHNYGVVEFGLSATTLEEVFVSLQEREKEALTQ